MKKLIKISDTHYIIADNSEIKEGDFYWTPIKRSIEQCVRKLLIIKNGQNDVKQFKITHSTQPELLGKGWMKSVLPLLLSEAEEVINGYSVEKMADNWFYNEENKNHYKNYNEKPAWIKGFKAHQKLTKDKLFTAQPLEHLLNLLTYDDLDEEEKIDVCEEYIRNLLIPKTEWNVKFNEQGKLELI